MHNLEEFAANDTSREMTATMELAVRSLVRTMTRGGGAAFLLVVLVGCTGAGGSTDQSAAEPEAISKAEFIAQANAVCRDASVELQAAEPDSNAEMPTFFYETVIPSIRQQVADMRALGFPEGDEDTLDALFDDTETVLSELEADRDGFGVGPEPFTPLNRRLAEYGLTTCAED